MTQDIAVTVYTKNDCFGCTKTKQKLDQAGIEYTTVNVEEDAAAFEYVTATLGLRQMPVVIVSAPDSDTVWSGLAPTKIREHITHRADAA
ncbi:glutaredoxin family protein [Arthrobacter sp. Z1-15]